MLDVDTIDLENLIGGSSLIKTVILVKNRIRIRINVLVDTEANRFIFIYLPFVELLCSRIV
jgi:hypothetical protein